MKLNVSRKQFEKEIRELRKSLNEFEKKGSGDDELERRERAEHEYDGRSPKKKARFGLRQFGVF